MSSLVKSECPESVGLQETTAVATHSSTPDTFSPPPSQPQIVDTPDPGLGQPLSDDLSLAPLSFAQQRLWFLDQLNPRSALYNIPMALRMFGELSVTALQQAIAAVVDRHHVLRTRIRCIEGEPWQDTCDPSPVEIPLIDFSTLPEESQESELQRQLSSEARTAFHLSGDLLFRAKLFRMGAAQHVLFVNMHHVASDAFSFVIFFREVSGVYGAIVAGRSTTLPDLPIQYADYAAWQRETVNQAGALDQLAYWKRELAGVPQLIELPTDRAHPATSTLGGGRRTRPLPTTLISGIQKLSREEGVTSFMLLLTAFNTLLYRLTHQEDFLVGVPITGRDQIETEGLIGFFSNTIVMRSRLSGALSFRQFLQQTRATVLDAYDHADVPFEKLVEALSAERSVGRSPLIQVMFTLQNALDQEIAIPGLQTSVEALDTGTAKFDLTLTMTVSDQSWLMDLEYNSDVFDDHTIDRWLSHLEVLLSGVTADPDRCISDLPLLTQSELRQLFSEWNQTARAYPRNATIHQLFEEQVRRKPEALAVSFGRSHLTYRQLNERANKLAHHLKKNGLRPGTIAGLCMERCMEMIISLLAILKAGAAYAALDVGSPEERTCELLREMRVPILLTQERFFERFNTLSTSPPPYILCLDRDWKRITGESIADLGVARDCAESLAYVCFTSGSTGKPKGVCIPHRAVVRLVRDTNYANFENEVFLQAASVSFDASTFEIWGPLLNGAQLVLPAPGLLSIAELKETMAKHRVTTAWFTVGWFNQIVEADPTALQSLRQILTGGDALSVPHIQKARLALPDATLINGYGPTENTTFSTCYQIPSTIAGESSIPIGRPISNSSCYVLDEHLQPCPVGIVGELFVGGDGLAIGYLNEPELTAEKFIIRPDGTRLYRTGDRVRYLADGNLEFLGRNDSQIKIRGFRVELGEIEAALHRHPAVQQCVVIARPDAAGSPQLIAYVVSALPDDSVPEWRPFLRNTLPEYMVPTSLITLKELPLSANGKIARKALPEPESGADSLIEELLPQNSVERELQSIWQEILQVRAVGIRQNFFLLGGHSLLALRLVAQIEKRLNKNISVAAIFQNPTIEQLAATLRNGSGCLADPALIEIQPYGSRPPLVLVHGVGGGMLWGYSNLARHLGLDQPVFALQPRSPSATDHIESIQEIATSYISSLRQFQPVGPYFLGGYCFGGVVAYEMARRLQAEGETIGLLAVINSNPPNSSYTRLSLTPRWAMKFIPNACRRFWNALRSPTWEWGAYFRWKARAWTGQLRHLLPDRSSALSEMHRCIDFSCVPMDERPLWQAHVRALINYQPTACPVPVTLFRSPVHALFCSFDPSFGWSDLALDGVTVRIIPGAHETIMKEPNVRHLAKELTTCLSANASPR